MKKVFLMIILTLIQLLFITSHECRGISKPQDGVLRIKRQFSRANFEGDILVKDTPTGLQSSAVYTNFVWPDGKIPYVISDEYNQDDKAIILSAMNSIQEKTCIQFIHRTNEDNYINIFKAEKGCSSFIGKVGAGQMLSLDEGCVTSTVVKHELMHAIGFYHEQSRSDRDQYVIVHEDNIKPGEEGNFIKHDSRVVQLLDTPYDTNSIMHYVWNAFALNVEKPTISRIDGLKIEHSDDFSETDILDMNRLYKCNKEDPSPYSNYDWKDGDNGQLLWAHGCDFYGNDIQQVKSRGEDCGALCIAESKCTHFTWGWEGNCYLKSATKNAVPIANINSEGVCGYVTRRNSAFNWRDGNNGLLNWAHGCDFFGNDIRHVKGRGEDCGGLCLADPKCTHFSWGWEGNCYLKTAAKNAVAHAITYEGICGWVNARV